jgi:predicted nucleic acid-binding protein
LKVLFDTNVVLDVLLDGPPHAHAASALFALVERDEIEGLIGATSVTTVYYLAAKAVGPTRARKHLHGLLSLFDVAPVDEKVLASALNLGFPDFEDAVLHEAARRAGATRIVSRDAAGFARGRLPVYEPQKLLQMIEALE